jgi:dolichyl-phosphate beta-glucosyltransferase
LVKGCKEVADEPNRGIAVGSRAHLVGSEAVVKVCLSTLQSQRNMLINASVLLSAML